MKRRRSQKSSSVKKRDSSPLPDSEQFSSAQDSLFFRARSQLQISALPSQLPCRDKETNEIRHAIVDAMVARKDISGMPGTGKTACVTALMQALKSESLADPKAVPPFRYALVNALKLFVPQRLYTILYEELTGKTETTTKAAQKLRELFTSSLGTEPFVVVVDEVDFLMTKKQEIIYSIFDWTKQPNSRLITIAITNTMDLVDRLQAKIGSRMGSTQLIFLPYSRAQLQTIVESRLRDIDCFSPAAVEYCTGRIAMISGDVRRALAICKRAAEIAEEGHSPLVEKSHVEKAVTELHTLRVQDMKNLTLHEQLFLACVVDMLKRKESGGIEVTFGSIAMRHAMQSREVLQVEGPNTAQIRKICSRLIESRFLEAEAFSAGKEQRIRLAVQEDDVRMALENTRIGDKLFK